MPTPVKRATRIVLTRADKSSSALTTEIPVMRAVLLQFVFSIAGLSILPIRGEFDDDCSD
jgi:hypothetical protein